VVKHCGGGTEGVGGGWGRVIPSPRTGAVCRAVGSDPEGVRAELHLLNGVDSSLVLRGSHSYWDASFVGRSFGESARF